MDNVSSPRANLSYRATQRAQFPSFIVPECRRLNSRLQVIGHFWLMRCVCRHSSSVVSGVCCFIFWVIRCVCYSNGWVIQVNVCCRSFVEWCVARMLLMFLYAFHVPRR